MKVEYTIQTSAHPQPTPEGQQTYTARVLYKGRTYEIGRSTDPDRAFLSMLTDGTLAMHAVGDGDRLDPSRGRSRVTTVLDRHPAEGPPMLVGGGAAPEVPRSAVLFSLGLVALGAICFASLALPEKS